MKITVLEIMTRRGRNCMKFARKGLKLEILYMLAEGVRSADEEGSASISSHWDRTLRT